MTPEVRKLLRRAAEMQGRTVSEFVLTAAHDAALKTISDMQIVRVSLETQEKFAAALLNAPEPPGRLKRAIKEHRELIVESK